MAGPIDIPRPPDDPAELRRWAIALKAALDPILQELSSPAGQMRYTVTHGSATYSLDVTGATVLDVAKLLGTLIGDLQKKGQIG